MHGDADAEFDIGKYCLRRNIGKLRRYTRLKTPLATKRSRFTGPLNRKPMLRLEKHHVILLSSDGPILQEGHRFDCQSLYPRPALDGHYRILCPS